MAQGNGSRIFDEQKLRQLKELMRLNPTLKDTAAFFECGERTIEDTIRHNFDMTFREFRDQNMVHTRLMLQRTAVQKAEQGDNTMLIFCLKNLCGWSDKQTLEHLGADGEPVKIPVVVLPSNGYESKN